MKTKTPKNTKTKARRTAKAVGSRPLVSPDFISVVELVTFRADTVSNALRDMARWLDENGLSESDEISVVEVSDADDGGYRASVTGRTRNGISMSQLLANVAGEPQPPKI